jgi:hypothetical protein
MVCADLVHSIKCLWLQVPNIKSLSWHEHPHRRDSSQGSSPSITSRLLPSFCLSVQFKLVKFNFLDGRMTSSQLDICLQRLHPDVQSVTFLIIRDLLSRVRLHLDLPNTTLDSLLRDQLFKPATPDSYQAASRRYQTSTLFVSQCLSTVCGFAVL